MVGANTCNRLEDNRELRSCTFSAASAWSLLVLHSSRFVLCSSFLLFLSAPLFFSSLLLRTKLAGPTSLPSRKFWSRICAEILLHQILFLPETSFRYFFDVLQRSTSRTKFFSENTELRTPTFLSTTTMYCSLLLCCTQLRTLISVWKLLFEKKQKIFLITALRYVFMWERTNV